MLIYLTESTFVVSKFTYDEIDLVAQLLNMLIDSVQGPCAGNQDTIIAKSDTVAALNVIVHTLNPRDVELTKLDPGHTELRGLSRLLLAACLEGRDDHTTHDQLRQQLEVTILEKYREELEKEIWHVISEAKSEARLLRADEATRTNIARQFLAAVTTVLTELKKTDAVTVTDAAKPKEIEGAAQAITVVKEKREPLVGTVEIAWRGKVERTCFPLPLEINYLSTEMKQHFLTEVDLSTSERRMKVIIWSFCCV